MPIPSLISCIVCKNTQYTLFTFLFLFVYLFFAFKFVVALIGLFVYFLLFLSSIYWNIRKSKQKLASNCCSISSNTIMLWISKYVACYTIRYDTMRINSIWCIECCLLLWISLVVFLHSSLIMERCHSWLASKR